MRHFFASISHKLLGAALFAFYLQASFAYTLPEEEAVDDNLKMDSDMIKRNWNKNLKMWGKRAWSNLHGGWGVKRSISDDFGQDDLVTEKRAWENFRNGWGKRRVPLEDLTPQELSLLENELQYTDFDNLEENDDEKRSWNQLNNGWGKRNKWSEFRGSWGKRSPSPAWNNLKGIWGKRSYSEKAVL
ncbi:prothoracicostatic peptide isoform X2 [Harmonia axyridis]|uniref:prothoracicostatic peptide isoform X2 n=1 Tax=Harmonia axyridis TaxID=115357 RepID=UPI001E2786AF|nr:prothoracicostatic peptide isoform X2 [Harmonia axyridis]